MQLTTICEAAAVRISSYKATPKVIFRLLTLLLAAVLAILAIALAASKPKSFSGGGSSPTGHVRFSAQPAGSMAASVPSPSPAPALAKDPGKALIVFTFDDGYVSDYNLAYKILKQYGIRGTSYIIGKFPDNSTPDTLSWAQIKEMKAYGWDFGCHTYDHVDMTKLTPEEIKSSLEKENRAFISQGLEPPQVMAYPSGTFDQKVIDVVKQYRKQARLAFYESKFVDLQNVNPYEIDSISADMQEPPRLLSREKLVDKACGEHAVIVFRTHCMYFKHKDDNGKWDVQTDSRLFEQLVKYCVDRGCQFATMTQLMGMYPSR